MWSLSFNRLVVDLRFLVGRFELHDDGAKSIVAAHDGRFQEGLTLRMCFAVRLFAEVDAEELLLGVGWSFGLKRNLYSACFLRKRHTVRRTKSV